MEVRSDDRLTDEKRKNQDSMVGLCVERKSISIEEWEYKIIPADFTMFILPAVNRLLSFPLNNCLISLAC